MKKRFEFGTEREIPPKILKETRILLEKQHSRSFSEEEVSDAAGFVYFLAETALEQALEQAEWDEKLTEFPQGYHLQKGGVCRICRDHVKGEDCWYDQYGLKCMLCKQAIYWKIIPAAIAQDDELYYSETGLVIYFNLEGKVLNQWIKDGLLKARTILKKDGKKKHYRIFLLSDNKGFLPPKKMFRTGWIEETVDGQIQRVSYPWYYYPHLIKRLQKYGIAKHIRFTTETENQKPPES